MCLGQGSACIRKWLRNVSHRSPAQVGCMRQALGPGALGRPRGSGWRGRWEGRSGWGTHVNPWLIHFNVWQNPLQYCTVISLQLIKKKKNFKKKKEKKCLPKEKSFEVRPGHFGQKQQCAWRPQSEIKHSYLRNYKKFSFVCIQTLIC